MTPPASIVFPTRRRHDYLAVALASVCPQAREHGAEVLVVEDDPEQPATRRLAEANGASYLALGAARGINVARNAGAEAARGELVCLLDDDVEVWPGWLAALLSAADACPGHDAFGGPIRPRLESARLCTCGREPVPITHLDLGPRDRDADFVWGANLALRRSAFERVGGFDPELNFCGDEEDWQRRLHAGGGRIRYVARAGVDHRRAGGDARLPALTRAAHHRGRHARRYDEFKRTPPPLGGELRVLAGCVWHTGRHVCANGIILGAMSAGRLRAALAPPPPLAATGSDVPDFLSGRSGTLSRRGLLRATLLDATAGALTSPRRWLLDRAARGLPVQRVLVLGVARPENAQRVRRILAELGRSRHEVEAVMAPGAPGAGKWANLNAALEAHPPAGRDWLLLVDDDVALPDGFLDSFLFCCRRLELALAQPAHAYASHAAWSVTRRRPGVLARETRFVEIGPVTAIAARAFPDLLPLPDLQMGWGLDFHWSAVAAERGHRLGIVDATPIRHQSPVAAEYPRDAAVREGEAFLRGRSRITRAAADATVRRHLTWRR